MSGSSARTAGHGDLRQADGTELRRGSPVTRPLRQHAAPALVHRWQCGRGWLMSARARAWARLEELRLLRSTAQMKLVPVGLKQLSKPRRCAPTLASYEQHLPQLEQQPSARRQHRSRRPSAGPSTPHGRRSSRADQPRCRGCGPRVAQQAQSARRQTRPSGPPVCGGQSAAGQEPEHRRPGRAVHPRRSAGGFAAYSERLAAAHPAAGSSRYGPHVFTCALQLARLHCMCTS